MSLEGYVWGRRPLSDAILAAEYGLHRGLADVRRRQLSKKDVPFDVRLPGTLPPFFYLFD